MSPLDAPLLAAGSLTASHGTDRTQLASAAKQFEAIFVRQMLAAARKTDFGGNLLGGQGLDTFRTMQDEHFADLAADTGAFGMAKLIEAQLSTQFGGESPSRLREGLGVGLLNGSGKYAPSRPLPQAGGENVRPVPVARKA